MARPLTADTHDQLSGRCARLPARMKKIQKTLIHDCHYSQPGTLPLHHSTVADLNDLFDNKQIACQTDVYIRIFTLSNMTTLK